MKTKRIRIWERRGADTFLTEQAMAVVASPGMDWRIVDTFKLHIAPDHGPKVETEIAVFRHLGAGPLALIEPNAPRQVEDFIATAFDHTGKLIK